MRSAPTNVLHRRRAAARPRPSRREMERACAARDASYDGVFVLAVRTTGIFCRPSCPARAPRRANMRFFDSAAAALAAGYRACKRCRPLESDGRAPAWVAHLLRALDSAPDARLRDADLRVLGVDPARARRYFKKVHGMTFQAFQRARRMGAAHQELHAGARADGAGYGCGYESASGFRAAFKRTFGQPPGAGHAAVCIRTCTVPSPVGPLTLGATDEAVCLLEFAEPARADSQFAALRRWFGGAVVPGCTPLLQQLTGELEAYFAGRLRRFTVPLAFPGTPFQVRVWSALLDIPYGETICYAELARQVSRPQAQRAAGLANGRNRIAIVIPCHRVVNKGGQLGGYGGGLWRKQWLLDHERGVTTPGLFDGAGR